MIQIETILKYLEKDAVYKTLLSVYCILIALHVHKTNPAFCDYTPELLFDYKRLFISIPVLLKWCISTAFQAALYLFPISILTELALMLLSDLWLWLTKAKLRKLLESIELGKLSNGRKEYTEQREHLKKSYRITVLVALIIYFLFLESKSKPELIILMVASGLIVLILFLPLELDINRFKRLVWRYEEAMSHSQSQSQSSEQVPPPDNTPGI